MNCPLCCVETSEVKDSRRSPGKIRRRRQCTSCGHKWTTVEIPLEVLENLQLGVSVAHTAMPKIKEAVMEAMVTAFADLSRAEEALNDVAGL